MKTELLYIREINLRQIPENVEFFPFSLPVIRNLDRLKFDRQVTFFVGENGSGKSTLLEAIALNLGLNPEGGNKNIRFSTQDSHSELGNYLSVTRGKPARDFFFLRAESFYNVQTYLDEINELEAGKWHSLSHGEAFFRLLNTRFRGNGLYLLDEPEAALSPSRQLSALSLISKLVGENSQFIIATHSPIILAYPNAKIYSFDSGTIAEISYEATEHFQITRQFLDNPSRMLRLLL